MEDVMQVRNEYRRQQWAQIIRECQSSGVSNTEYCRQHGISEKTYYYWMRKLQKEAIDSKPQLAALENRITEESGKDMLHIRFRVASLDLPSDTDADAIVSLLQAPRKL